MKYLLILMGMAMMLYFGALPAFVPGQPSHRIAQRRQFRWLSTLRDVQQDAPRPARRTVSASGARRTAFGHAGQWVNDARRAGTGWAKSVWKGIVRGATSLFEKLFHPDALAWQPMPTHPMKHWETPPCDLGALNREYADLLTRHRRRASPAAPQVQYDAVLFKNCRAFNLELEAGDLLYHSLTQPNAELCGMSTELGPMRGHPRQLAQYILAKFNESPRHAVIQARADLVHVAVSATDRFFIVRLNTVPTQ